MKKTLAVACLAFATTIQAQAAVLSYDFTATIGAIAEYNSAGPWAPSWLSETEGPNGGPLVKTGQHIVGKFSFDTATPPSNVFQTWSGTVFSDYIGNASASYSIVESGIGFSGSAFYNLADRQPGDNFYSGDELVMWGGGYDWQLRFTDPSHKLFANGLPTTALSLNNLTDTSINDAWWRSDGVLVSFNVQLDSLSQSQVPEPASFGLLLAGFGAFAAARRRRRG
jgi:hypothetical protein